MITAAGPSGPSELVVSSPGGAPAPGAAEMHERMRAKSAGQYDLAEDDQFGHARVEQVGDSRGKHIVKLAQRILDL